MTTTFSSNARPDTGRREAGHTPAQDITPSAVSATKSSNLTTEGIPNLGHSAIVSPNSDECYKFTKCHIRNAEGIHDDFFDNFTSVDDPTDESPVAELEKIPVYLLDVALASKSGYELEPPVNYYRSVPDTLADPGAAATDTSHRDALMADIKAHPLAKLMPKGTTVLPGVMANTAANAAANGMTGVKVEGEATTMAVTRAHTVTEVSPDTLAKVAPEARSDIVAGSIANPSVDPVADPTADDMAAASAAAAAEAVPDTRVKAMPAAVASGAAAAAAATAAEVVVDAATALARAAAVAVRADNVASAVAAAATADSVSYPVATFLANAAADPTAARVTQAAVLGARTQAVPSAVADAAADARSGPVGDLATAAVADTAPEVVPDTVADPGQAVTDTSHLDAVVADIEVHPLAKLVLRVAPVVPGVLANTVANAAASGVTGAKIAGEATAMAVTVAHAVAEVSPDTLPKVAPEIKADIVAGAVANTAADPIANLMAELAATATAVAAVTTEAVPDTGAKVVPSTMADDAANLVPVPVTTFAADAAADSAAAAIPEVAADARLGPVADPVAAAVVDVWSEEVVTDTGKVLDGSANINQRPSDGINKDKHVPSTRYTKKLTGFATVAFVLTCFLMGSNVHAASIEGFKGSDNMMNESANGAEELQDDMLSHLRANRKKEDVDREALMAYTMAKAKYSDVMAETSLAKMKEDYDDSVLNGNPDSDLPSIDKVKVMFDAMYDSFHSTDPNNTSSTNVTRPSEEEALLFVNSRMTRNERSSTFKEVMVCRDMFLAEDTNIIIDDQTDMNLTINEIHEVGNACYHDRVSENLKTLGFNPSTFCPMFERILPLQFQVLQGPVTQNLTSFCSFLVDTVFETAGEPECLRRMEEVQLTDTTRSGMRYAFPAIANGHATFDSSYNSVCTSHDVPYSRNPERCNASLSEVKATSAAFLPGDNTMISYISDLCDAFGLPLPHPNETIRVRYADPHVHHKPGGKPNIKLRHVMSDLFNFGGHYRHGFMNKYGRYIDHPTDKLLDPTAEVAEFAAATVGEMTCEEGARRLNPEMTCDQRNLYCTGLAFSVGAGVGVSAGPMSIGGGVDFGFGVGNDTASVYEETFVWGICGSIQVPLAEGAPQQAKAEAQKSQTGKKMDANDIGVSVGISAGGWTHTGHIPGFAETISISFSILVVEVGFELIETFADAWVTSNGFHGFILEVGLTFPPEGPVSVDFDQAKCYGETIKSADGAVPSFPKQLKIDMNERFLGEVCGPNMFSLNIENTGATHSETHTGLSLYYYKSKFDWDNRVNRVYIVHYCGNILQGNKLTTMGHGDHFTTQQVYGVGIAAHHDDAYKLGHVSLWQAVGGNKWVAKFVANELDFCLSTYDLNCYPNIEIKIEGSQKTTENNDGVFWRTGNKRVPYSDHCVLQKTLTAGTPYCEAIPQCDYKYGHSCGADRTITLNPCGSQNADKVWNIDEEVSCNSCAQNLQDKNLIHGGWSCSPRALGFGLSKMAIRYTPRAQYNPPYDECDAEDCDSLTVTCTGGMYVEIIRDGRTREAWVKNIRGSWEDGADNCCKNLKDRGYFSSCSRKHVGGHMNIKYKAHKSCTQHCTTVNPRKCDWQRNVECGTDMTLSVLNPCNGPNHDDVDGLWEGGCQECGQLMYNNGDIEGNYNCDKRIDGMYLTYTPQVKTAPKCTPVTMLFDSSHGEHANKIDDIADDSSWENSCAHMATWLKNSGYITSYYRCEKTVAGIWLNYTPTQTWYPISYIQNANDHDQFQCDYRIAHKETWCSATSDHITTMTCHGDKYLRCSSSSVLKKCDDWSSYAVNDCDCLDSPLNWYDRDGSTYDCDWYSVGSRCASHGNGYARDGTVANKACCACGGGSNGRSAGKQAELAGNDIIGDSTSHNHERDTVAALG